MTSREEQKEQQKRWVEGVKVLEGEKMIQVHADAVATSCYTQLPALCSSGSWGWESLFFFFFFLVKDIEGVDRHAFLSLLCTRDLFLPHLVHCTLIKRTTKSSEVLSLSCPSSFVLLLHHSFPGNHICMLYAYHYEHWFMCRCVTVKCTNPVPTWVDCVSANPVSTHTVIIRVDRHTILVLIFLSHFFLYSSANAYRWSCMCLSAESQIWWDGKRTKLIRKSLIWLWVKVFQGWSTVQTDVHMYTRTQTQTHNGSQVGKVGKFHVLRSIR